VSPVKYEVGSYILEYGIFHSQRRENLKCYNFTLLYNDDAHSNAFSPVQVVVRNCLGLKPAEAGQAST
jgi:hypothetical protein